MDSSPTPDLDTVLLAKATRKTIERIVPFCQMRDSSPSDPAPIVAKTTTKIRAYIQAIEANMLAAQIGYHLASDAVIMYDPNMQGNDWETSVSVDGMKSLAKQGFDHAKRTSDSFQDVSQEIYKVAATAKDSSIIVLVPPDPGHSGTLRKPLKEVSADLVANLNLLNDFSRHVTEYTNWWGWIKEELSPTDGRTSPLLPGGGDDTVACSLWEKIKQDHQDYYNVICTLHERYPEYLPGSGTAWRALTTPQPVSSRNTSVSAHSPERTRTSTTAHEGRVKKSLMQRFRKSKSVDRSRGRAVEGQASQDSEVTDAGPSVRGSEANAEHVANESDKKTEPAATSWASHVLRDGVKFLGCHACIIV